MALKAQYTLAFMEDIEAPQSTLPVGALCALFTNAPTLTINSVLGDFTEPSFTGYTPFTLPTAILGIDPQGNLHAQYTGINFVNTGAIVTPVTTNGYFVHKTPGPPTLLFAEYFDTPVVWSTNPQTFSMILDLILPNQRIYGGLCAVC